MIEAYVSHPELFDRFATAWGAPTEDLWVRRGKDHNGFHVLAFEQRTKVARLATLGLASCPAEDGSTIGVELLIAVGAAEMVEVGSRHVAEYLADIATHLLRFHVVPTEGSVIARTSVAPWPLDAVLFDAPRGEAPDLEEFVADGAMLRLMWTVPIYSGEARLIQRLGIEVFDGLVERAGVSLADIRRPPLVQQQPGIVEIDGLS